MLFASLKSEHKHTLSVAVDSRADYSARELAYMGLLATEEPEIRATIVQRHAERLSIATSNVGVPLSRSLDYGKSRRIGIHGKKCLGGMCLIGKPGIILKYAETVGSGHKHTCHIALCKHH